jgi:hypothetical protein
MSPLNLYLATMKRNFYIRLICFIIAIISVGLIVLHMYHLAFSYAMKPNMQGLGVMLGLFGSLGKDLLKEASPLLF